MTMNTQRHINNPITPLLAILLGYTLAACSGVYDPSQDVDESSPQQQVLDAARDVTSHERSRVPSPTRIPSYEEPYPGCGDGLCEISEVDWCSIDCGYTPSPCGDGYCSGTESCSTCDVDCGPCYDPNVINVPGTPQLAPMSNLYARAQALGVPPSVAGVPNIETFLQSGYLGGVSATVYPTGATSVQDFINKLFQNGIWQNTAPGQTSTVLAPDSFGCQLRQVDERYNPEDLVSFDAGAGLLFPSALNQGSYVNLGVGALTPLHVPAAQRKPAKLVATFYQTATANTATATDVYNSMGQLLQAANAQGAITQSNTYFEMKSASSLEEAAAKFKLDAKIMGSNISSRFSSTTSTKNNTVFVRFTQSLFTVFQDLGGFTPALGQFNPLNFGVLDLERLGDRGELGYDNLPTYVRSVTYGRMLLFSVSSSSSKEDLEAAVNAVYGPFSGSATAQQRKLIQDSQMSLFAYGGPAEPAISVIKSGVWQDYFTLQNVPLASLKPIGYEVRRLDDQLATMSRTTRYTERVCPGEHKIEVQLSEAYKDAILYVKNTGSSTWKQVMSTSPSSYNSAHLNSFLVGADDEIKVVSIVGQPGFLRAYQSRVRLKIFVDGVEKVNEYYSCTYCHSKDPVWVYKVNKYTGAVARQ